MCGWILSSLRTFKTIFFNFDFCLKHNIAFTNQFQNKMFPKWSPTELKTKHQKTHENKIK